MRPAFSLLAASLLLSASVAAHADTIIYQLTEVTPNTDVTYSSASGFVTSSTPIPAQNLTTCSLVGVVCGSVQLITSNTSDTFVINFPVGQIGEGSIDYLFAPGAFTTLGTYASIAGGNTGTLTVTDLSTAVAVTPEPSSLILLGTGVLAMAAMARRRFIQM